MLSTSYKSHMIRYSSTGHAFKHVQKALEHLRHSSTWALGHLRHSDTWALRALRHFSTRPLKAFGHLGAWELEALYLADSLRKVILSITLIIFDQNNNSFVSPQNNSKTFGSPQKLIAIVLMFIIVFPVSKSTGPLKFNLKGRSFLYLITVHMILLHEETRLCEGISFQLNHFYQRY